MLLTVNDPRQLVVSVAKPSADTFYNPKTQGWEQPFDPTKHSIPFKPIEAAPSLLAAVQVADVGNVLLAHSDAVALLLTVDPATGAPIAVADVWTFPTPTPNPVFGGFVRV